MARQRSWFAELRLSDNDLPPFGGYSSVPNRSIGTFIVFEEKYPPIQAY